MKNILKISAAIIGIIALVSCSNKKNPEARKALDGFKNYVDSVVSINDSWKNLNDTVYQEVPVDPKDPSKIVIDTAVITPAQKKTILYPPGEYGFIAHETLIAEYQNRLQAVEAFAHEMNEPMKKELEDSKAKFEALLPSH